MEIKIKNVLIPLVIIVMSLIFGLFVGISWLSSEGVSLGEASCGCLLTMIFIIVSAILFKLFNEKDK